MPQALAVELAQRITGASEPERPRAMADTTRVLEALFGGDTPQALAQVAAAGDLPDIGALAGLSVPSDRARVSRALARPEPRVDQGSRQRATRAVDEAMRPLARSLANTPGGQQRFDQARRAALATALNDVQDGVDPQRAGIAAGAMYGRGYQFRDGWRAPRVWNGEPLNLDRVSRRVHEIERALVAQGDDDGRIARRDLVGEAQWVTRADDRGLLLYDPRTGHTVSDAEGNAVSFDWDQIPRREILWAIPVTPSRPLPDPDLLEGQE